MHAFEKTGFDLGRVIEGCKENKRRAQSALVRHYLPKAKKICYHYVRNPFDAEEIADDGFVKIFSRINRLDQSKPFEPWLKTIMARTAIDFFRRSLKQKQFIQLDEDSLLVKDPECFGILSAEELMQVIGKLPQVYRQVFSLYHIFGFDHNEIAERLGITPSTSRANLAKAKSKLRNWINLSFGYDTRS
jgi:RNA polymerase sigma factor (sigma-70 family)